MSISPPSQVKAIRTKYDFDGGSCGRIFKNFLEVGGLRLRIGAKGDILTHIMENQLKNKMENETTTGIGE